MSLDITIKRRKDIICPKCGEVVAHTDVDCVDGGGRTWHPFLESIGYYIPYEQRTEENNWYGKDMVLTDEQTEELYDFIKKNKPYGDVRAQSLIATALCENEHVVINADW